MERGGSGGASAGNKIPGGGRGAEEGVAVFIAGRLSCSGGGGARALDRHVDPFASFLSASVLVALRLKAAGVKDTSAGAMMSSGLFGTLSRLTM